MKEKELLHSCSELIDYIDEVGMLPLLRMGIPGWSAEEVLDEDCQYTRLPDGGWEWPLWEWKSSILQRITSLRQKIPVFHSNSCRYSPLSAAAVLLSSSIFQMQFLRLHPAQISVPWRQCFLH